MRCLLQLALFAFAWAADAAPTAPTFFSGSGSGDAAEWLSLLNTARTQWSPNTLLQDVTQLYFPQWNGFVEGPTWGAWWTQNSYGPTYTALPFMQEPLLTFVQNSQDLWFHNIADGKRSCTDCSGRIAPDGCLCDDGTPDNCDYLQGDGDVPAHEWALEETLSAVVMQSELLLISRDGAAAAQYLPLFARTLALIESRRDPASGLFAVGQSSNLLAPSFGAWLLPNGTRARALLTGIAVSYVAALDRVIELETMAGDAGAAARYAAQRSATLLALPSLLDPSGRYFVKSRDGDGTLHGVLGQARHGYIEAVVNHDSVCFNVAERVKQGLAESAMAALLSDEVPANPSNGGPGIRPFGFVITQAPGLDDMEAPDTSWLWQVRRWWQAGCSARGCSASRSCAQATLTLSPTSPPPSTALGSTAARGPPAKAA